MHQESKRAFIAEILNIPVDSIPEEFDNPEFFDGFELKPLDVGNIPKKQIVIYNRKTRRKIAKEARKKKLWKRLKFVDILQVKLCL